MSGKVYPLYGEQADAVDPLESVWLKASAGTGKTQVLSARVLRLLLRRDVRPSQILCLTFTKAGAAEMATRVNDVLARWVRMDGEALAEELRNIGARDDADTVSRARSLFASVLDCPGGGLRIDTIHAFAQWLLAAFPEEAGLLPGTRALEEGRETELLSRQVLAELLVEWQSAGETQRLDALADLSVRMGPDDAQAWLMRCAKARDLWIGEGAWPDDLEPRLKTVLGLQSDAGPADLAAMCRDDVFDVAALKACADANTTWGKPTGLKTAAVMAGWLALSPVERFQGIGELKKEVFTQGGTPRSLSYLTKTCPDYETLAEAVAISIQPVIDAQLTLDLIQWLAPALRIGRLFALRWDAAKKREGVIDFDDQIRSAAALLSRREVSDWIRYKLDREFDHILIDEAQDTNAEQWSIIKALTDDFFSGKGQRDGKQRTIFVVGDYKQAIFGFQGTSPENFEAARVEFEGIMAQAAANAPLLRDGTMARELKTLGLGRSFRTAQPVLDFVDNAIEHIGFEQFGLDEFPGLHSGDDRPGEVVLWNPVSVTRDADSEADDEPDERRSDRESSAGGEDEWLPESARVMADKIADQVSEWLKAGYPLVKGTRRMATPGDIMVLVRARGKLAALIVARLYAAGVPVAGVDRLRLGAPLAVKDLMAALRFAAQPRDSLSIANLLVSPLIGWSQQDLLDHAYRNKDTPLWHHLRASDAPLVRDTVERLRALLRLADFEPPQALLHWMLLGPWEGRRKLVARLGREANDPIDELLNAAGSYAAAHTPSLQGFIQWFDAGDGMLKRDAGGSEGLVRVMTVHGSKGLQAPIVILADATGDPDASHLRGLTLPDGERSVPIPTIRAELAPSIISDLAGQVKAREKQEHWRLLYVAMTRAEEALYIGGALGKGKEVPPQDSWYARLEPVFSEKVADDPHFGGKRVWGQRAEHSEVAVTAKKPDAIDLVPKWALEPVGPEPRPSRPLSPSGAGEDSAADPPLAPEGARMAARRGVLIHRLLERLPEVEPGMRDQLGTAWLERHAADLPAEERTEMLQSALRITGDAHFADVFAPGSLAEVPLSAIVDGVVVSGTVDRLLVTADTVTVVDYKTARRPPGGVDDIPEGTLRQMAAYVAALEVIYPSRRVSAALLYTQTPVLIALGDDVLAPYKRRLSTSEQSFLPDMVE